MDRKILKEITEKNDFSDHDIVLTGGEPALHPEIDKVVQMMCEKSKTVTITTNGIFDHYINGLSKCKNLLFQISIDGAKDKHDEIRGKGTFEKTWESVQELERLEIPYSIASVVSRKNRDCVLDLLPQLEQLKNMRFWRVSYEMPFGSGGIRADDMMSADEWNEFVSETIRKAKLRLKIQKIFPFELYDKRKEELTRNPQLRARSLNCGSGKDKIYVYPDFNVYPCTCLTDFCLGNLSKNSLSEILQGDKTKVFSEYQVLNDSQCMYCEYKELCNGGCIGMSYHMFGKLGMGDRRCPKLRENNEKNFLF